MKFPIRQEIEVLSADEPKSIELSIHDRIVITSKGKIEELPVIRPFTLGWSVKETIGIAVVNTRAVASARKSIVTGK